MNQHFLTFKWPKPFSIEFWACLGIAIAVLVRIVHLDTREFWYDEVLSVLLSSGQKIAFVKPPDVPVPLADYTQLLSIPAENSLDDTLKTVADLLRGIVGGEPHPPLFYLSQHLWLRWFGNGVAAVRSLNALFGIGAIAAAYGFGRRLLGHRPGLLFAALLGLNPFYLNHSLNVRMYAPLVFWGLLSAWALLEIIGWSAPETEKTPRRFQWGWHLVLIGSVCAGCMTFYLFAYWVLALAALCLYLDRRQWWQHGIRLGAGVLLTAPWMWWGIPQQLRNADFGRFDAPPGWWAATVRHAQDVAVCLGSQLVLGDWTTSVPLGATVAAGIAAIAVVSVALVQLWQWERGDRRRFGVILLLSVFILFVALSADAIGGKFTLGFGWGRSTIYMLPGFLLLFALWLERLGPRWRSAIATVILAVYLLLSVGDYAARSRRSFQQIADLTVTGTDATTAIALNSRAWGHVMRLAYYIPPSESVLLLARDAADLPEALARAIEADPSRFDRVLWLDSAAPVWSPPSTPEQNAQIAATLSRHYGLQTRQTVTGTMEMDNFTLSLYD
jgi:uncharacterized membrane protein